MSSYSRLSGLKKSVCYLFCGHILMVCIAFYRKCEVKVFSVSLVSASVFMKRKLYWRAFYRTATLKFFRETAYNKSSRPEVFSKKGALGNFAKIQRLFFNKIAGGILRNSSEHFLHKTPLVAASVQCIRLLVKWAASLENELIRRTIFWTKSNT